MYKVLILGTASKTIDTALCRLGLEPVHADNSAQLEKVDLLQVNAVFLCGGPEAGNDEKNEFVKNAIALAKENGAAVLFDPQLRSFENTEENLRLVKSLAAVSDVFLPNLREAQLLCGLDGEDDPEKLAAAILDWGTKKTVITLGKQGAYFKSRVECGTAPTFRADNVVDYSGAGDGFAAGLISGICEEIPLSEAVVRANAVGSMQIQNAGEDEGLPTMEQLREYMLSHRFVVDGCKDI